MYDQSTNYNKMFSSVYLVNFTRNKTNKRKAVK